MVIYGFYQVLSMSKLETDEDPSLEGSIKSVAEGPSQVHFYYTLASQWCTLEIFFFLTIMVDFSERY